MNLSRDTPYLEYKPDRSPYHSFNLATHSQNLFNDSHKSIELEKYVFEPSQRSHPLRRASFGIHCRKVLYLLKQIVRAINSPEILVNIQTFYTSPSQFLVVLVNGGQPLRTNIRMTPTVTVLRGGGGLFWSTEEEICSVVVIFGSNAGMCARDNDTCRKRPLYLSWFLCLASRARHAARMHYPTPAQG